MSLSTAPAFDLSSLGPIVRVGLVALAPEADPAPAFTRAEAYREWGYQRGLDGLDLGPAHLLPHPFWCAAVQGYKAGRAEVEREAREALAWTLGRLAGSHGHKPRLPRAYSVGEAEAYGEGWGAGDAERRDWLAGHHGGDHDQQPDPFDVEANTIAEGEWHEVSEGFTRYPDEEAVEVFGRRAGEMMG